jgi:hypothetical protein
MFPVIALYLPCFRRQLRALFAAGQPFDLTALAGDFGGFCPPEKSEKPPKIK